MLIAIDVFDGLLRQIPKIRKYESGEELTDREIVQEMNEQMYGR